MRMLLHPIMSANEEDNIDDSDKGERKRQREKQRRSDLASAFDELQAMLNTIEPAGERYSRQSPSEGESGAPFTRLDLIRKSTEAMRRIHHENLEMRRLLGSKSADTVSTVESDNSARALT